MNLNTLLVTGSRTHITKAYVYKVLKQYPCSRMRFGDAAGVDTFAHAYCHEFLIPHDDPWVPAWDLYGHAAGFKRNEAMVATLSTGDYGVAIWDGSSRGTQHTIQLLRQKHRLLGIFPPIKHPIEAYFQ